MQLGESLEEQLGQRLLRMPPPPQLPPRVRQGQQHAIEQQQQPSMFQLPYELPPVLSDPMQVRGLLSRVNTAAMQLGRSQAALSKAQVTDTLFSQSVSQPLTRFAQRGLPPRASLAQQAACCACRGGVCLLTASVQHVLACSKYI
jgi:hypothetical protein